MREFLVFLPLSVLYLAFKSVLAPGAPLPDLPLIIVFYMAFAMGSFEGALMGFILGYIDDVFNGALIGSSSFALVFVFLCVHLLSRKVHFYTALTRASGALGASIIKGALVFTVLRLTGLNARFFSNVILQSISTGVFAPAVIVGLSRLSALVSPRSFKDDTG